MKHLLFFYLTFGFCLFFSCSPIFAQNLQWAKCFGGTNYEGTSSIVNVPDGYVAVGQTNSNDFDVVGNHGGNDIWLFQISNNGILQWQHCFGGTDTDYSTSLQKTTNGGYILSAITTSNNGDVSGNHGGRDIWIAKLDHLGAIQWQKCYGGSNDEYDATIQQTSDGGYIFAGATTSNDGDVSGLIGAGDIWVVKIDSIGDIEWQKCLGGTNGEAAYDIKVTPDGGYILTGYTYSNDVDVSGSHDIWGGNDIWVVKIDSIGNINWQKCFGGDYFDWGRTIQLTSDGNYILVGYTGSSNGNVMYNHSSNGSHDIWVIKIDTIGNIIWQKCYGGFPGEQGFHLSNTPDNGYIITGNSSAVNGDVTSNHGIGDMWVVKIDSIGNIIWQRSLGGSDDEDSRFIQPTPDGGYIVAGITYSNDIDVTGNHGGSDCWIVKFNGWGVNNNSLFEMNNILITPNPIEKNYFNIHYRLNKVSPIHISIFDIWGRLMQEEFIHSYEIGENQEKIMVSSLPSGMYIVQLQTNDNTYTTKIEKQ